MEGHYQEDEEEDDEDEDYLPTMEDEVWKKVWIITRLPLLELS